MSKDQERDRIIEELETLKKKSECWRYFRARLIKNASEKIFLVIEEKDA
ncbi:MAG: hypothetical protein ACXQTS_06060 [Candidatus Methanospirareceae archaeon]